MAIQILREFSASEFIGKVYVIGSSDNWLQVTPYGVSNYDWYEKFRQGKQVLFEMQGGELWEVLEFRTESDESGSYIAVALRHHKYGASQSIANTPNEQLDQRASRRKKP